MAKLFSLTVCRVGLVVSWAIILTMAGAYGRLAQTIAFRNATGVGLTEDDVTRKAQLPDQVITSASQLSEPAYSAYEQSRRPMTARALVYFRFRRMIVVYLDDRGQVVSSYWGRRHRR